MTSDTRDLDDVKQDLKYDHRNLLTEMRVVKKTGGGDGYETYQLMYNYDEAGNRVRKRVYFYQEEDPMPVFEEDDMTGSWDLVGDEYYVRDVSGKEIAVYHSYDLDHWNVWGTDNVGKINANGDKFFYLKDHLGSVRVVLNSSNQIVSAHDYDCWGYPLENRSYQSDDIDYKFTGKQRDAETGYDYFGARYYDARIGRWGGVEPLLEKYISYSPYQYGLLNPVRLVDANGFDLYIGGDKNLAFSYLQNLFNSDIVSRLSVDDNGKISFNTDGLDTKNDAAIELIDNMVNQTSKLFLFEVADQTTGIARGDPGSTLEKGATVYYDFVNNSNDVTQGLANLSETARNVDNGTGLPNYLPKKGFNGQVTLGKGRWTDPNGTGKYIPIEEIVFHELAENYERTINNQPYMRKDFSGAHANAVSAASRFSKQKTQPPGKVGRYVPSNKLD